MPSAPCGSRRCDHPAALDGTTSWLGSGSMWLCFVVKRIIKCLVYILNSQFIEKQLFYKSMKAKCQTVGNFIVAIL